MMSKKVAMAGMFTALAMIFSYVEVLIPINLGIPGMKLGLANLVVVAALYTMGFCGIHDSYFACLSDFRKSGCHALQSGGRHFEFLRHDAAEKDTGFFHSWSERGRRYSPQYRPVGRGHGGGGKYSFDFLPASAAHRRDSHRDAHWHCVKSGSSENQTRIKIRNKK